MFKPHKILFIGIGVSFVGKICILLGLYRSEKISTIIFIIALNIVVDILLYPLGYLSYKNWKDK